MTWRVRWAFVALAIVWGIPYFFIKLALREVSPLIIAWARILLAALILLPIAARRGALGALRTHGGAVIAFALTEFTFPFALIPLGERWVNSSVTAILLAAVPMTMAVLARFLGVHERLGARRVLGLALGFIGVITLVGLATVSQSSGWLGVGCILLATLGLSIGPLIVQRHLGEVDPIGALAASLSIASVLLTLPALLAAPRALPSPLTLAAIVVLGVVCTAIGMLLWFYLIHRAGALRASVVTYVNPGVAAVMGVVVLREYLGVSGVAGLALILGGSWLATRPSAPASTARLNASA